MAKALVYIGGPVRVTSVALGDKPLPIDFRYAPLATIVLRRRNMSRRATPGLMHRNKKKTASGGGLSETQLDVLIRRLLEPSA